MSREAWQASSTAINFPEGGGPFLPPLLMDDSARVAFSARHGHGFEPLVLGEGDTVESLAASLTDELQALLPEAHEIARAGLQRAVEEGYAPATALERLGPAFTHTAIRIVGQFLLDGDSVAAYEQGADTLLMRFDAAEYDPEITVVHELGGHKISGGTFKTREDGTVVRVRRGFVNYEDDVITSARHSGLDEAVQTHLTVAYIYGQFDVVDPDARVRDIFSYYDQRKLLSHFILRSGGVIELKPITRGSFEDSTESGAVTTDRRTMIIQAWAAYGPGAYYKLNLLFEAMDLYDMSADELAERIRGPEFNADGTIRAPGSIDLAGLFSSLD